MVLRSTLLELWCLLYSYSEAWEKKEEEGGRNDQQQEASEDQKPDKKGKRRVPKIYYATRTHSQIAQVRTVVQA